MLSERAAMLTLLKSMAYRDLRHLDVELGEGSEAVPLWYAFDQTSHQTSGGWPTSAAEPHGATI
jgi:hypothetical protein